MPDLTREQENDHLVYYFYLSKECDRKKKN